VEQLHLKLRHEKGQRRHSKNTTVVSEPVFTSKQSTGKFDALNEASTLAQPNFGVFVGVEIHSAPPGPHVGACTWL
jgi:hypothetical protein